MTTPLIRQTWTMSAVLINMFGQGMGLAYPASLLPALNRPDSPIKVDLHSSSWLGSIVAVSGIPSYLLTSVSMAIYGRRVTYALGILPGVVGWLLIYFGESVTMLMIGRFLGGLAAGTVFLGAVVIGEYTCPKYRGVFLCLKNVSVCMGAMLMHIISQYLHWRTISLMGLVPLVISLSITYTWPESPSWLASKCQYRRSEEAFYWLRGNSENSRSEIKDIIEAQKTMMSKQKRRTKHYKTILNFLRKFGQKDFLKPTFIMMLALIVMELSGRHTFPAYALHIMAGITGETTEAYYYTLAMDIIMTMSAILASILIKIMNRRTLLFSSGLAASIVLISACLYLSLASKNVISKDKPWIPISILVLYFILVNLGCAPIPSTLFGEVFPLAHRGVGTAVSGVWFSICLLGSLQSTPYLLEHTGVHGFFAVFGCIMGVALLILYFIMPETKDKTLHEIEKYFVSETFTKKADDDGDANTKMIKDENNGI